MRRKLGIVGVGVLIAGLGLWRLFAPFQLIHRLDTRYQQVQPGMSTNEVQLIMKHPGRWSSNATYRGWDGASVPGTEVPRIGAAVAYAVPTFFLGVTFEFVFDENGKTVGKYRYD